MGKHTIQELYQMQSLSLDAKIRMTAQRVKAWYEHFDGEVYVSFSGGKDSTVLVDIVRNVCGYDDVPLVFVDTGLEYPEIKSFVKTFNNVTWLKPSMQFREVIEKYGYPFISKEVSNNVDGAKRYINNLDAKEFRIPTTKEEYEKMVDVLRRDWGKVKGSPQRLAIMLGMLSKEGRAEIPSDEKSQFSMESYKYLLESPFLMSSECCAVMKKKPAHLYYKEAKKKPIIATMAEESSLRTRKWLQNGCNGFDLEIPTSTPLSFWTEQDILQYIKTKELPICSVYGDIVYTDDDGMEYTEQLFMEAMPLKTTGCNRTGCMFCGYGCHLEKEGEGRFERMKHTHPQIYEWIMKPWSDGGLDYKNVIDWLNENGGLNIKY